MKTTAFLAFQPLRLERPSFPLKQCSSVPETLGVIVHEKYFRYRMYFSQKPILCRGKGDEYFIQITNMQSVPGLLASIVDVNESNNREGS